jgi:hypothetical protein
LHLDQPYPTEAEKKELAAEAGMTMRQVCGDFFRSDNFC